jgi:hypothetical protein
MLLQAHLTRRIGIHSLEETLGQTIAKSVSHNLPFRTLGTTSVLLTETTRFH